MDLSNWEWASSRDAGCVGLLGTYFRPRARILLCWAVKVLDDRLVMYLFASRALSAFLLIDFRNLFLLFEMKLVQILNLRHLSGLFLVISESVLGLGLVARDRVFREEALRF